VADCLLSRARRRDKADCAFVDRIILDRSCAAARWTMRLCYRSKKQVNANWPARTLVSIQIKSIPNLDPRIAMNSRGKVMQRTPCVSRVHM
jgi:hypothetical protein